MILSISGLSGSGKSTLAKRVSVLLKWPHVSAGTYFRDIAKAKGYDIYELSSLALRNPEIDKETTQKVLGKIGKLKNCVLDAHGAALVAKAHRQVSIFLHCPLSIRAERIFGRTHQNDSQRNQSIEKLDNETVHRFRKIYEQDILDLDQYDLVVNTNRLRIDRIVLLITELIKLTRG